MVSFELPWMMKRRIHRHPRHPDERPLSPLKLRKTNKSDISCQQNQTRPLMVSLEPPWKDASKARLLVKREIAKSRAWIETEARQRRNFFLGFMFEPRNRLELSNFAQSRSRSRRENFSSVRDPARSLIETNTHPAPSAHPPKNPYLVCWCTLSGTCVDQMCLLPPPPHPTFPELWCVSQQTLFQAH